MTFSVKYRGRDGGVVDECLEAQNRTACVAALRERGIVAISILEVCSGKTPSHSIPNENEKHGNETPSVVVHYFKTWQVVVTLIVALLLVSVGAWWLSGRGRTSTDHVQKKLETKQTQRPKEKSATISRSIVAKPPRAKKDFGAAASNVVTTQKVTDVFNGVPVVSRSAVTNANGTVVERIRTADGKSHRINKPRRNVFEHASDQLIAMAIQGANSGVGMPPLPVTDSVEEDFRRSLATPIVINDDDSDEVKLIKMDVMAVRDVLKERVAQGMKVRQALEEHQDEVNKMASYNAEALAMLRDIREKEGPEAANDFLKTVNKKLAEMGGREISAPAKKNLKRSKE